MTVSNSPLHRRSSGDASAATGSSVEVRRLTAADAHWCHDALNDLLRDVVAGGGCVGFVAPLSHATSDRYWVELQPLLDDHRALWVATLDGRVCGAIQWQASMAPDAAHRGRLSHLLVATDARLRGVARALVEAVEREAAASGRTLLVLDVATDTSAEALFIRSGWQPAGHIPAFAASPAGVPRTFSRLYKALASTAV